MQKNIKKNQVHFFKICYRIKSYEHLVVFYDKKKTDSFKSDYKEIKKNKK